MFSASREPDLVCTSALLKGLQSHPGLFEKHPLEQRRPSHFGHPCLLQTAPPFQTSPLAQLRVRLGAQASRVYMR